MEEQIVSNISEEVEEEVDGLFEDWFSVEKRRKSILCFLPTLFCLTVTDQSEVFI